MPTLLNFATWDISAKPAAQPWRADYFFNVVLTDGLTGRTGFDLAGRLNQKSRGENLIRSRFTLCHTIGDGDRLDPIRPT